MDFSVLLGSHKLLKDYSPVFKKKNGTLGWNPSFLKRKSLFIENGRMKTYEMPDSGNNEDGYGIMYLSPCRRASEAAEKLTVKSVYRCILFKNEFRDWFVTACII